MEKFKKVLSGFLCLVLMLGLFNLPVDGMAVQAETEVGISEGNYRLDYERALEQLVHGGDRDDTEIVDPDALVRVIVEVEGDTTVEIAKKNKVKVKEAGKFINSVKEKQKPIIEKAKKISKVRHSYQNVFNGFSAEVKFRDIEQLRKIPGVKNVSVAVLYEPDVDSSRAMTNATYVWNEYGLKGEGTVIAIVDSGIDPAHPDLKLSEATVPKLTQANVNTLGGPGKFFTKKVPYGYNFADMNFDVVGRASDHGIHVAGIAAANGSVLGVAPEAQLLAMKVFTNNPEFTSAYSDDIAAAIDDSVRVGADVINMSLGSAAGFVTETDPHQKSIRLAAEAGVVTVVSAGNSAYSAYTGNPSILDPDMGLVGSPGCAPDTLQVASVENSHVTLSQLNYVSGTNSGNILYLPKIEPAGILKGTYEVIDCKFGHPDEIPASIAGKIALIERGGTPSSFVDKQMNAQLKGAAAVIVRNHVGGGETYVSMASDNIVIPSMFITYSNGMILKNFLDAGQKVSMTFPGTRGVAPNVEAWKMAASTSWGTTPGLDFKPEVTAPGGNIFSLSYDKAYSTKSGTSMASPHTAGGVALVLQYLQQQGTNFEGKALVELAKKLVINSSDPLIDPETTTTPKLPYLTRRQGAGLIKLDRAIKTSAYVTGSDNNAVVALKEVGNSTQFTLNISNFGNEALTFVPSDRFGVLTNATNATSILPRAALLAGATLSFDKPEVNVPAMGSAQVTATLTIPASAAKEMFAEGFITLTEKNGKNPVLGIPYMGYYGQWDSTRIFDRMRYQTSPGPYYANTASVTDSKGYFLGFIITNQSTGAGTINEPFFAISPNGDGIYDDARPNMVFLRNAREFRISILDSSKNVIRHVAYDEFIRKTNGAATTKQRTSSNWVWDGMLYNVSSGTMEMAPEGQYYIKVEARIDYANSRWQAVELPVRVDLTSPSVNITSTMVTAVNKLKVDWTANDNVALSRFYVYTDENLTTPLATLTGATRNYEFTLTENTNKVYIEAMDTAGNLFRREVAVDNSEVFTLDLEDNAVINKASFDVNYTINPQKAALVANIKAILNGTEELAVNSADKKVSLSNLRNGSYLLKVQALNSNNVVLEEKAINFTVNYQILSLDFENDSYVNKDEFKIPYTINPNVAELVNSIRATLSDGEILNVDTAGKLIELKALKNGVYTVTVDVLNANAEVLETKAIRFVVDYVFPTVTFVTPKTGNGFSTRTIQVKGTISEKVKWLKINDLETPVNASNGFDTTVVYESDGTKLVRVEMEDLAGNISNYVIRIYIDTTAPEITMIAPTGNDMLLNKTNNGTYTLNMTVKDMNSFRVFVNGQLIDNTADGEKTYSHSVNIPVGESFVRIQAIDSYGFKTEKTIRFYRDIASPQITITSPVSGAVIDANKVVVSGTITDELPVTVKVDGTVAAVDAQGNFTTELTYTSNGAKTITVEAVDAAGNQSSATVDVTLYTDATAPQIIITSPVSGSTIEGNKVVVSGRVIDESAVTVKVNGAVVVVDAQGNFSTELTYTSNGAKTITVEAIDVVGNQSSVTMKVILVKEKEKKDKN